MLSALCEKQTWGISRQTARQKGWFLPGDSTQFVCDCLRVYTVGNRVSEIDILFPSANGEEEECHQNLESDR